MWYSIDVQQPSYPYLSFSRNKHTLPLAGWLAYRGNRVTNKIDGKLFSRALSMVFIVSLLYTVLRRYTVLNLYAINDAGTGSGAVDDCIKP